MNQDEDRSEPKKPEAEEKLQAHPGQSISRAQNVAAVLLTIVFLGGVIGGGIYLRKHSAQGASGPAIQTTRGAETGTVVKKVNDLTVTLRMPARLRVDQN